MLSFTSPWEASLLSNSKALGEDPIRCVNLIVPRLYLSDLFTAQAETTIAKLKITHIISVIEKPPVFSEALGHIQKLHIQVSDTTTDDLLPHLQITTDFIRAAFEENAENRVLVHCLQGISRSPTVVCAYVIATTNMTASEAVDFVRNKRPVACPNPSFRKQLDQYATGFYGGGRKAHSRNHKLGNGITERIKRLKRCAFLEEHAQP